MMLVLNARMVITSVPLVILFIFFTNAAAAAASSSQHVVVATDDPKTLEVSFDFTADSPIYKTYLSQSIFEKTYSLCNNSIDKTIAVEDAMARLKLRNQGSNSALRRYFEKKNKYKIEGVNFASGSTGSRLMHFTLFAKMHLLSQHMSPKWKKISDAVVSCVKDYGSKSTRTRPEDCASSTFILKIAKQLEADIQSFELISDTPQAWVFAELFLRVPWVASVVSFRDIDSFLKTRFFPSVGGDLMCRPELWLDPLVRPKLLHPFDVLGCLQLTQRAEDAIVTTGSIYNNVTVSNSGMTPLEYMRMAYITMNTVNYLAALTVGTAERVLPICIVDYPREDGEKVIIRLVSDKLSSSFLPSTHSRTQQRNKAPKASTHTHI
jgi:hypothetical protein